MQQITVQEHAVDSIARICIRVNATAVGTVMMHAGSSIRRSSAGQNKYAAELRDNETLYTPFVRNINTPNIAPVQVVDHDRTVTAAGNNHVHCAINRNARDLVVVTVQSLHRRTQSVVIGR